MHVHAYLHTYVHIPCTTYTYCTWEGQKIGKHILLTIGSNIRTRNAMIHNLDVSIYCHLCITIQRYIAQYNQV